MTGIDSFSILRSSNPVATDQFIPGLKSGFSVAPEAQGGVAGYRLVKAAKSPTNAKFDFEISAAVAKGHHARIDIEDSKHLARRPSDYGARCDSISFVGEKPLAPMAHGAYGRWAVIERRLWSGETRIRTQVETANSVPDPQTGPRITVDLSDRGLRALTDSAAYVAAVKDGYTTFVTLTFTDETRLQLQALGYYSDIKTRKRIKPTTIQREASRCFDAWQKMYKRGMRREGITGNDDSLDYLWVVEVPKNAIGEDNPHLHVLMRWSVPFEQFKPWSGRLEKAWGQGFAHIEKIKKGASAGAYIAKAAGYLCKAQGASDQGAVRGNRYGISECARAPGWETLTKTQMDCMSQLIADVYDHLTEIYGADYQERKKLNKNRGDLLIKAKSEQGRNGNRNAPDWIQKQKKKIENRLEKVRKRLDDLPIRANKYQVILKTDQAFADFMAWAQNRDFNPELAEWLPKKPEGVVFRPGVYPKANQKTYFVKLREKFHEHKRRRSAWGDDSLAKFLVWRDELKSDALSGWDEWLDWHGDNNADMNLCQ